MSKFISEETKLDLSSFFSPPFNNYINKKQNQFLSPVTINQNRPVQKQLHKNKFSCANSCFKKFVKMFRVIFSLYLCCIFADGQILPHESKRASLWSSEKDIYELNILDGSEPQLFQEPLVIPLSPRFELDSKKRALLTTFDDDQTGPLNVNASLDLTSIYTLIATMRDNLNRRYRVLLDTGSSDLLLFGVPCTSCFSNTVFFVQPFFDLISKSITNKDNLCI